MTNHIMDCVQTSGTLSGQSGVSGVGKGAGLSQAVYQRRLECGPWFEAGEQLDGAEAFARILEAFVGDRGVPRPYAVYVHVPFCHSICSFCALYTSALGPNGNARLDRYLDAVLRSLDMNPWCGRGVSPTTIHFGGGTPLVLGEARFERLVRELVARFGADRRCELALETTTSSLAPPVLDMLEALGIRRVHLGIQTLDDGIRGRVGRRERGSEALDRINTLESRGFFTSVDLILGLDGVDETVVRRDLGLLHSSGVRMYSICELRDPNRKRFLNQLEDLSRAREHLDIWRTIWSFMQGAGLKPIHIGQFARNQEDNLYFTHPARGEDCVAVGPYSHGTLKHLSYANLLLPEFQEAVRAGVAPLAMGVDYRRAEQSVCAVERELLAHELTQETTRALKREYPGAFDAILDRWFDAGLLETSDTAEVLLPTASGSWYLGNMIGEIRALSGMTAVPTTA